MGCGVLLRFQKLETEKNIWKEPSQGIEDSKLPQAHNETDTALVPEPKFENEPCGCPQR